ncbi:MAG: amidohydrolase [Verrucomicrobiaceae bacterium]|nr:amidohydrolase [Verrucomicrobiaceae bacterium]
MKHPSRRRFLATTGILPLVPGKTLFAEPAVKDGWIDAHVHVWPADREKYPLAESSVGRTITPEIFDPAILRGHQKGTGVTRTVLIQMSFYGFDNSYMLDVIESDPERYRGVAIVDHSVAGVGERMKELGGQGVRGFRLYAFPDRTKDWAGSAGMREMWKVGGEENLAMCCLADPAALPAIQSMCETYPDTPVVIDHFARIGAKGTIDPAELARLLALAAFPQVHVKVSAFYALGKKQPPYTDLAPMIRELRDAYGSERLMWGSDCPYQVADEHSYAASVALVREKLDFLSDAEKTDIMKNTAEKVFFR